MAADGAPFSGVLYAGLMLTPAGPKLIEYNVRFGDPECQTIMLRLASDLVELIVAACDGRLAEVTPRWHDGAALTVVMAAENYPGTPLRGTVISGIEAAEATGAIVFHAGTARDSAGRIFAAGGRVLGISATGSTVSQARKRAYAGVDRIDWPHGFARRDIGQGLGETRVEHAAGAEFGND